MNGAVALAFVRDRGELYRYLVYFHRLFIEKFEQDVTYSVFYRKLRIFDLFWRHFKKSAMALCMDLKKAHSNSLSKLASSS